MPDTPSANRQDSADRQELANRILQRTESLQTNCAEALLLPYRRHRVPRVVWASASVLALTVCLGAAVALAGVPEDRAGRAEHWQAGTSQPKTPEKSEQQADLSGYFFRGLQRILDLG